VGMIPTFLLGWVTLKFYVVKLNFHTITTESIKENRNLVKLR